MGVCICCQKPCGFKPIRAMIAGTWRRTVWCDDCYEKVKVRPEAGPKKQKKSIVSPCLQKKTCLKCDKMLDKSCFYSSDWSWDRALGVHSRCKACCREAASLVYRMRMFRSKYHNYVQRVLFGMRANLLAAKEEYGKLSGKKVRSPNKNRSHFNYMSRMISHVS